jgi:hypothetical protein
LSFQRNTSPINPLDKIVEGVKKRMGNAFSGYFSSVNVTSKPVNAPLSFVKTLTGLQDAPVLRGYYFEVQNKAGTVGCFGLYDGRSVGHNTLGIGRLKLQNYSNNEVLITQRTIDMHSEEKEGYDRAIITLKNFMRSHMSFEVTGFENISMSQVARAVAGLTVKELETIVRNTLINCSSEVIISDIIARAKQMPRSVYPTQQFSSFPGAGEIFRYVAVYLFETAYDVGYETVSAEILLPSGLQNFVLYQRYRFKPIVRPEQEEAFERVRILLSQRGSSVKDKAWLLSGQMEGLRILVQRQLAPVS